eukprot:UN21778
MNENDITDSCNCFQISRKLRVPYYYKYDTIFNFFHSGLYMRLTKLYDFSRLLQNRIHN